MSDKIGVAILAGGKGTRMKVERPKALTPILGECLIDRVLEAVDTFSQANQRSLLTGVVTGYKREELESYLTDKYKNILYAFQEEQLGTADALKSYFDKCKGAWETDYTIVLCADTPLLEADSIQKLWDKVSRKNDLQGVVATFETEKPRGYGRILKEDKGLKIVEEKDATEEQRRIKEVNSGVYIFRTSHIKKYLFDIKSENKAKEFYLTDLFDPSYDVDSVLFANEIPFLGVNSHTQLEQAEKYLLKKKISSLQEKGVHVMDSHSCYIEWNVEIEEGSKIFPGTYLLGKTKIGEKVLIEPGCFIKDSIVEKNVSIKANSYLEEAHVKEAATIGPFARLRPGSDIGEQAKVGNFVEVKKSVLEKGSKVSHLSYIGDAHIGAESNIGCGFITCNYDGANKHKTVIGKNSFIGSDCQAVAPVSIGDGAFVAAGSTITKDVPSDGFAVARGRQVTKPDMAKKFLKHK